MNYLISLPIFLAVGTLGGYLGTKLKIPAGALIGSLLAVICFKLISGWTGMSPRRLRSCCKCSSGSWWVLPFRRTCSKSWAGCFPGNHFHAFTGGHGTAYIHGVYPYGLARHGHGLPGDQPRRHERPACGGPGQWQGCRRDYLLSFFRGGGVVFIILTMPLIYRYLFR